MRYAIGALLSGLFIIGLLLCCESMAPEPSETTVFDKGYNAGFQMGTEETLKVAAEKGLGEFFFDEVRGRQAFRWFVDGRPAGTQSPPGEVVSGANPPATEDPDHQYVARRAPTRHGLMRKHKLQKPRNARADAGSMDLMALRREGA